MEKKPVKNESDEKEVKISTIFYAVLLLAAAIIVLFGILIYGFKNNSSLTRKIEKIIPYPAAIINNYHFVNIDELNDNLASVKKFYESQDFSKIEMRLDFSTENGKKRLKIKEREIFSRMIENEAIEIIAKKKGVRITNEMIDHNLSRKIEDYGNSDNLINNLGQHYGWSVDDFKKKVIEPDIYRQELEKIFLSQDSSAQEAKAQIEKVKSKLDEKGIFTEVAKNYSKGSTAEDGGELGWFRKDQLIPDIADSVFSLEKGKRSEILESSLGFHIVEVEDKKTENDINLARIRQIFIPKKTFAEYLTGEMKNMKFKITLKEYSWDQEKLRVEFRDKEMINFEQELINNSQGDASISF